MKTEALVVGGGLAGAAVAITLARAGRDVVLVEREAGPKHKVCGEFLSAEALGYLGGLGVEVAALGAVKIARVRMAGREVRLPFEAMSVTRRALDEALLERVAEVGARVLRGSAVEGVERMGERWSARIGREQNVEAGAAFLATGKHDLRGWGRPEGRQDGLVAFKMYWRLSAEQARAMDGVVELFLYRGGYAGLQLVEDGSANLGCLIEREELKRLGGGWEKLLEAMLAGSGELRERLRGAEPVLGRALAVSAIPYGMVRERTAGVWCVGDQAAVIPSFTGDGMSIALHTGMLAARMYLEGATAREFQRRVGAELRRQVGLATWISRGMVGVPRVMAGVVRVWPGVLGVVAKGTRIASR